MTDPDGTPAAGHAAALHQSNVVASSQSDGEASDDDLVRRAQDNPAHSAAFAELYRRHLARVYRYQLARLGDATLAQDATAQTFLAALEGLYSYRRTGEFRAWLLTIARNKAADVFRRQRPVVPLESVAEMESPSPSPETIVVARLDVEAVLRAMRALAPERAEALAMRVFGEMSVAEIAMVMRKREAAVKMLIYRAMRDLRERLGIGNEAQP